MDRQKKIILAVNSILAILFVAFIVYLTIKIGPHISRLKPAQFHDLLAAYGPVGILIFISLQILQVIVAAIPGEIVQLAGGYIYGTFWGTLYSGIGIFLGSVIAFYIARLLGYPLVKNLVSQKELDKFNFVINSPKSEITMFLLFLIPGIPKDFLVYIAGVTPIKPGIFFLTFIFARFPGILASSYIGSNIERRDYLPVVIVSLIACALFLAGVIKKDLIIDKLHHALHMKEHPEKES